MIAGNKKHLTGPFLLHKIIQKVKMYKNNPIVIIRSIAPRAHRIVFYLTVEEVKQIEDTARDDKRNGERNSILIQLLFETGLRVSEALSFTPRLIDEYEGHAVLFVKGKGKKARMIACPNNLAYSGHPFCIRSL